MASERIELRVDGQPTRYEIQENSVDSKSRVVNALFNHSEARFHVHRPRAPCRRVLQRHRGSPTLLPNRSIVPVPAPTLPTCRYPISTSATILILYTLRYLSPTSTSLTSVTATFQLQTSRQLKSTWASFTCSLPASRLLTTRLSRQRLRAWVGPRSFRRNAQTLDRTPSAIESSDTAEEDTLQEFVSIAVKKALPDALSDAAAWYIQHLRSTANLPRSEAAQDGCSRSNGYFAGTTHHSSSRNE
ncbi:hypothetical protein FB567DRAFT_585241 [Paraphoma chrysanthemicola]|uniref:Uncharacterized protein n=1 Tax=Paraphoma chrysanthemicola TaxID=798071 RepID=A0A8K0QRC6_9PLEO|nr:hypothetical protein FB567DRAFT_585241 [Paraphoma chrysanthemicola]